jgi:hypothetical protein
MQVESQDTERRGNLGVRFCGTGDAIRCLQSLRLYYLLANSHWKNAEKLAAVCVIL